MTAEASGGALAGQRAAQFGDSVGHRPSLRPGVPGPARGSRQAHTAPPRTAVSRSRSSAESRAASAGAGRWPDISPRTPAAVTASITSSTARTAGHNRAAAPLTDRGSAMVRWNSVRRSDRAR